MNKLQVCVLLFLFLTLALRIGLLTQKTSKYYNNQHVSIERTLLQEPTKQGNMQRFSVFLEANDKVFITTTAYPALHYGQNIQISGILQQRVLGNEKIVFAMSFPKITAKGRSSSGREWVLVLTAFIRQRITASFLHVLPSSLAGLLLGIVFGIKEAMPKDMLENFRVVGMLHMVAASGMNVSLLGGFLSRFLAVFLRRQIALLGTIGFILFYTLLAGAEASIVRAACMGILVWSAQIIGRQYIAPWALGLAAYGMVLFDPYLLSDIGFQLSFSATAGLLYMRPLFEIGSVWFRKSFFGEDLATTLVAQAATLPILLANFGTYSPISILANALALWPVPLLMILGSLAGVASLLWEPLAFPFLYLSLPLLWYIEFIGKFFGQFAFGITIDAFPMSGVVGYYLVLLSVVLIRRKQIDQLKDVIVRA